MTNQFKANQKLSARSIGDHNCIFRATVIKTTAKTVTILNEGESEAKRCKVHEYEGVQFIYPFGQYSMAARFKSNCEAI